MLCPTHSPKRLLLSAIIVIGTFLGVGISAQADPVTIDFEGLTDSTAVTTQYSGLIFINATILTAGVSLNEFEFPPHSGTSVLFDEGGGMSISFGLPVTTAGGYFTYTTQLTITAYDMSNNVLGTLTSAFNNNLALSGDLGSSPSEFLSFSFLPGIARITISGDPLGDSFTLDDLMLDTPVAAVPEPATFSLLFGRKHITRYFRKKIFKALT